MLRIRPGMSRQVLLAYMIFVLAPGKRATLNV